MEEAGRIARKLDNDDVLQAFKSRFVTVDPKLIYLDGNSLGRLSKTALDHQLHVIQNEWGTRLIRSWNEEWFERSTKIAKKISLLIGAHEDEVMVCDSVTVNLFKLIYAALNLKKERSDIVTDELNFPTDLYVLQGIKRMFGNQHTLLLSKSLDEISISKEALENQLSENTAIVCLSHVLFKSAYMYPLKEITEMVHRYGALVLWDLSHSAGAVPLHLTENKVDLAVGCTYKYLNGGPGAPAFIYVNKNIQEKLESPIWGWFGHKAQFEFNPEFQAMSGIGRFLTGTPSILSLSPLDSSLDIILEAGIDNLRKKSIQQSTFFIDLYKTHLVPLGFKLQTPQASHERGSHVTLSHPEAYRICKALINEKIGEYTVIPDFREPDNIRFGIAPLYTSYLDIVNAVSQIKLIVQKKLYDQFSNTRDKVT